MTRWIAFDSSSAAALAAVQVTPELHDNSDALAVALSSPAGSVVLMPARAADQALVVRIRHLAAQEPPAIGKQQPEVQYEATGFLGLIDAPVYPDDEPPKPKTWWQKICD